MWRDVGRSLLIVPKVVAVCCSIVQVALLHSGAFTGVADTCSYLFVYGTVAQGLPRSGPGRAVGPPSRHIGWELSGHEERNA